MQDAEEVGLVVSNATLTPNHQRTQNWLTIDALPSLPVFTEASASLSPPHEQNYQITAMERNKASLSFTAKPLEGSNSPDSASHEGMAKETPGGNDSHIRTIGGGAKLSKQYGPVDKLDRYLSSKPIISFGLTLQASWEAVAISFQSALLNGGPSALVYGMLLSTFGSSAMAATLAEMASINPAVGAQYRWTAMLAPRNCNPRFLGYLQVSRGHEQDNHRL